MILSTNFRSSIFRKTGLIHGLIILGFLQLSLPASAQDATQPHWTEVKQLISKRAYREALQELEIILRLKPNDPLASTYRILCEKRLRERPQFRQLGPEELVALQEALRLEQEAQAKAAALDKALERQIKKEQAKWDAELKALEREAIREQKAKQRQAKLEAALPAAPPTDITRAAQAGRQQRLAKQVVREPTVPPPTPPTPPSREGLAPPVVPEPPAIELEPVIVPTAVPKPVPEIPVPPAVLPPLPPRPAGAVQIFADQLGTLPDRKLAVAQGNVRIVFDDGFLTCDKATLFTDTQDVYAEGRVRLERGREVFRGEVAHYNLTTKKGRFLEGTAYAEPWYEHGRVVEHVASGVLRVQPGYLTSCEFEPPHFRLQGRQNTVFTADKIARGRNVTLMIEEFPFIYLPWLTVADRQTPFFLIPGKKKPWEQFALMGYRYEWPTGHRGALRWDWRRAFGWAIGTDHRFETERLGKGLFKVYYNEERNIRRPESDLPKGADINRYRVLWRHNWQPLPDTTVVTDLQEFSDVDFRRELLFREEFVKEDAPESFISMVTSDPNFTLSAQVKKRLNRFQTVDEALPQLTAEIKPQRIGETQLYSDTKFDVANFQTKRAHSDNDTDVVRVDWFQQLSYALNLFRPILVTPRAGVRQTYYTKDIQSSATALTQPSTDRPQGKRDLLSGQFSMGADASLKLFRIFPVTTNWRGLNINLLRHVLTPTLAYAYVHEPTVPNSLLTFAVAGGPTSQLTLGLENKLQTKRPGIKGKPQSVDLARFLVSIPYTFHGSGNEQGGRLGDWSSDLELYPWPWMRLETDWVIPSHFVKGTRDDRIKAWNLDLVIVGGPGELKAQEAPDIQAPERRTFQPGQQLASGVRLLPEGQWYFGLGHRYSQNDKTEEAIQFDWRISKKWQIGTFHRFTWKEVAGTSKRFNNVREYQYTLTRDLHDWIAELIYRVDREFGEELFFTMTLKAYPDLPIEIAESYHQPKIGSQSSPFSPLGRQ